MIFKLVKEERTITNIIKRIDFANFTDLLNCIFYENGTYSGSGYFGNGSGTYKAEGDMIYTYIDGEELYRYKVHSISNGIAEVSMGVAGDNITLEIKLQKK